MQGQILFENLSRRNAFAESALRARLSRHRDDVLWSQFRREMEAIGDEIYDLGLAELAKRQKEGRKFEECVEVAQRSTQEKGIREVR
jgi:hypothetical protein